MGIGHWELLIVAFVIFLLFGHRFPRVMGSVGDGIREFRDALMGSASTSHELASHEREPFGDSTIHR